MERIIKPEIRSVTREVIGNYAPEELYSTKREAIEDEIEALTREKVARKYLQLDAILIRDVTLPQTLRAAIEQKLKQEQESLEYEFKIDKARKEAERKEIEAKGISDPYKAVWNADMQSSGIYFIRLTAGTTVQNQKIMLIK